MVFLKIVVVGQLSLSHAEAIYLSVFVSYFFHRHLIPNFDFCGIMYSGQPAGKVWVQAVHLPCEILYMQSTTALAHVNLRPHKSWKLKIVKFCHPFLSVPETE